MNPGATLPRLFLFACCSLIAARAATPAPEPLFDWSDSDKYRSSVTHPSGAFKPADVTRARENLKRYAWARTYAEGLERTAKNALGKLSPAYLEVMIPTTTPGDPKFTPCPACRDQGKPVHPHGLWSWNPNQPDQLVCDMCRTTFPHDRYPESIALQTTWGKPQTLTFYGGDPFVIFSYKTGRPSFSANIRARKVSHLAGLARTLAEAHLLSGNREYALGVRAILLRFAACYPGWLVHTGYGEYADMDPRVASQFINQLPAPELCPPPNRPDRKLHTGYWSAGRASGVGQESGFVRRMVEAYDFTCTATRADGTPVYSDAERLTIERDLLLEGTLLLVSDRQINNKSVGNRTAAALVGLCVGHPGLVRFGWDGFQQTIDEWFLPDGTTSESPAYATMTLGNIWDMPQALRGYSDPPGYRGPDGRRRDAVDLYHGTAYERVWENCFKGLQGNLTYPPFADSYPKSGLGANFVELMVANYPERPEYLALLKETCGDDLARGYAPLALYYREPGLEQKSAPPLVLPDWCPPELRIGHLRTGPTGRESLLLLSASRWGGHHHQDSLNLTYGKDGQEILSDLGYLWDHPHKHQTSRTLAHNTVLIDEKDQVTRERGGDVGFFRTSEHVKVMEASSQAYTQATLYRRSAAIIDHGNGHSYVVDFFRVNGGKRQDYVFHASAEPNGLVDARAREVNDPLYDFARVRAIEAAGAWRLTWPAGPKLTAVAWAVRQPEERTFIADGWGQRDWKNSDVGATLPYVVRRTEGAGVKTFISVFEAHVGTEPFVRKVEQPAPGVLVIETARGTDYVLSALDRDTLIVRAGASDARFNGRFAVASVQNGRVAWSFVEP
ncbi:heparinase II/III domain-containing protein [Horticoccus sp. 23ND18S-11]|uniref:heparinase II/III domain-containing protein n=1 Tax=Horticoccus sp. 23ND18S-11 TaxID=3391832 RepID=UPI0039C8C8F5